jgi:septum formation protein
MPIHPLPLILASASESRKQLLKQTSLTFSHQASILDESTITARSPQERVVLLSTAKAEQVSRTLKNPSLILAADTFIIHNNQILEKPKFKMTAVEMIKKLSASIHTVLTGWTVLNTYKHTLKTGYSETYVTFRELDHHEIIDYVNDNPVTQWAGGYNTALSSAIQFITKIEGSLTGLNGLPLDQIVPIIKYEYTHPYKKKKSKTLSSD